MTETPKIPKTAENRVRAEAARANKYARGRVKYEKDNGLFPGTKLHLKSGNTVVYVGLVGWKHKGTARPVLTGKCRPYDIQHVLFNTPRNVVTKEFTVDDIVRNFGYEDWVRYREEELGASGAECFPRAQASWDALLSS